MMTNEILLFYFDNQPAVHSLENSYIERYELRYYLLSYAVTNSSKYLAIVQNGYEYPDYITKTTELLKEHAGVTVTSWRVLKSAQSIVGKETLNNDEASRNLDVLLYESNVDIDSHSYALADVMLDFDLKAYSDRQANATNTP